MVVLIEICSAVICNHQSGMKPKEIVLKVNFPQQAVANSIKMWKETINYTKNKIKFWKASKVLQDQWSISFFEVSKNFVINK